MSKERSLLKLILIGDFMTGKTSLVHHYITNEFDEKIGPTIGIDYSSKASTLQNDNKSIDVLLQISDIAGGHKVNDISTAFWKGSDAVGIVLTIKHLNNLSSYYSGIKAVLPPETPIFFIVNKLNVSTLALSAKKELVKSIKSTTKAANPTVFFCSAKTGEGVKAAFDRIALAAYQYRYLQPLEVNNTDSSLSPSQSNSITPSEVNNTDSSLSPSQRNSITEFIANHKKWAFANTTLIIAAIIALVTLASLPIGALPILAGVTLLGGAAIGAGVAFFILNGICLIGNYLVKKDGEPPSSLPDLDNRQPAGQANIGETPSNRNPNLDKSFILTQAKIVTPEQNSPIADSVVTQQGSGNASKKQ